MILAHLSDLHLGFRGHGRRVLGRDARERDVMDAVGRAVEELAALAPDVVLVTGDVFDRPDPDPVVLMDVSRLLEALRADLPGLPLVLLAGPRDLPLGADEPGVLDVLGGWPGVAVATTEPRSLKLAEGRLHLALVPHGALVRTPGRDTPDEPAPDPSARFNVLAAHGRVVRGDDRGRRRRVRGALRVDAEAWDWIALGGEHAHRPAGTRAAYAGSPERVGWTPWTEALEEKGFLTVDLEAGRATFHPLPVRPVVALAPIRVPPGDTDRLLRRVREVTDEVPGGIDGRIVRLRLQGAWPEDLRVLQDGTLEAVRERALHLGLGVDEADDPAAPAPDLAGRLAVLLEGEGADPAGAGALLPADAPPPPSPPPAAGPGPFRVRGATVRLPSRGLVALVGREPRDRAALGRSLRDAGAEAARRDVRDSAARAAAALAVPATGDAGALLERAARGVAGPALAAVETALGRVRRGTPALREGNGAPARLRIGGAAAEALRVLERELADLRGDDAEVAGDVEEASMAWTRERQDAETQLQAYRDRARELKARLRQIESAGADAACPTCGRLLTDHFDDVVGALREEWEGVVQDGRWWKRRREQLEAKPDRLRELEGQALRIHAALEACAEKVERARSRAAEAGAGDEAGQGSGEGTSRNGDSGGSEGGADDAGATPRPPDPAGEGSPTARALARLRDQLLADARRRALLRASRVVEQVSGGRILFLACDGDGAPVPQGATGPLDDPAGEEGAALRLALLAVAAASRPTDTLVLREGTLEALAATDALRAVDVLRGLLRSVPRVIVVTDGRVVDRRPEAFDHAVELDSEGGEAWVRVLPVGVGGIALLG